MVSNKDINMIIEEQAQEDNLLSLEEGSSDDDTRTDVNNC